MDIWSLVVLVVVVLSVPVDTRLWFDCVLFGIINRCRLEMKRRKGDIKREVLIFISVIVSPFRVVNWHTKTNLFKFLLWMIRDSIIIRNCNNRQLCFRKRIASCTIEGIAKGGISIWGPSSVICTHIKNKTEYCKLVIQVMYITFDSVIFHPDSNTIANPCQQLLFKFTEIVLPVIVLYLSHI